MKRIIDLTLPLTAGMRGVAVKPAMTLADDGWNAATLELYTHCGTHMDAPRHFLPHGPTLDQQPLDPCIGPARVVDLTPVGPREPITVQRLAPWHDRIGPGDRLLVRTDWSKRLGADAYRNELPRISLELARWLVDRRVALVGVEPPSIADVNNLEEVAAVHGVLLEAGVVVVEGLANLDAIRADVVQLIVLPLPVVGGDGSPVRAVAIEDIG
ncbi:MAG: cyclase family protein [Planctomycetota bacterium]|jgi:kynurenine formamidase